MSSRLPIGVATRYSRPGIILSIVGGQFSFRQMRPPPELRILRSRAIELAVWEWPGEDPPLLFAHATGFHARCWDQIIRMLPDRRCLAIDEIGRASWRGRG